MPIIGVLGQQAMPKAIRAIPVTRAVGMPAPLGEKVKAAFDPADEVLLQIERTEHPMTV